MRALFPPALLALVLLSLAAPSAGSAPNIKSYSARLAALPFGQGLQGALKWVGEELDESYGPRIHKAYDRAEKDRLKKQRDDELAQVEATYTRFEGQRTGFEVSILQDEFAVGTKEAIMTYRRPEQTHWFFFVRGKFWKYARALKPDEPFEARVKAMKAKLGSPTSATKEQALWSGGAVEVALYDKRSVYKADLLILRDASTQSRIAELRVGGKSTKKADVDPELDGILDSGPSDYD